MKKPARFCAAGMMMGCAAAVQAQSSFSLDAVMTPSTSAASMRAANSAAAQMLFRRVESVEWSDVTFEEVIEWLRDQGQGHVNIIVRWGPLGVENVSQESLVNLELHNTRVADVLNEVLEYVADDGGQLAYHAYGNTLRLSTKQDFGRTLYMRVYDVADLMFRVPNFGEAAPQIDLQQTRSSAGGGGGSGQSVFSGGSSGGRETSEGGDQADQRLEEDLTKLKEAIEKVIAPETWQINGGRGRIEIIKSSLVVVNTVEVHEQIAGSFSFGG